MTLVSCFSNISLNMSFSGLEDAVEPTSRAKDGKIEAIHIPEHNKTLRTCKDDHVLVFHVLSDEREGFCVDFI